MSWWATINASFFGNDPKFIESTVRDDDLPTGSESGPSIRRGEKTVTVEGRLREFHDNDAPAALAWFLRVCEWADAGSLTLDLDSGPRYRYEWTREDGLKKLRGVLDL